MPSTHEGDIRASGERVIAIINDLLDLSRIETGKLDLSFTNQNLNELVESCVAVMQPQANPERIIIRTSLAHMLPPVVADARALRQITLNSDWQFDPSRQCRRSGHRLHRAVGFRRGGAARPRYRPGPRRHLLAAALEPFRTPAVGPVQRQFAGQSVADQGPGRSQSRQIPIDRQPYGHADRSGVFARDREGVIATIICGGNTAAVNFDLARRTRRIQ